MRKDRRDAQGGGGKREPSNGSGGGGGQSTAHLDLGTFEVQGVAAESSDIGLSFKYEMLPTYYYDSKSSNYLKLADADIILSFSAPRLLPYMVRICLYNEVL